MGALEGRIITGRGGGGGRGGDQGEGGDVSSSSDVLLRDLREEIRALRSEMDKKTYERESNVVLSAGGEGLGTRSADVINSR